MSHQNDHVHESKHSEERMSDAEKLVKMVEHWIHHNEDHANSYRDWATKAQKTGQSDVADILEKVALGTEAQNDQLRRIVTLLKASPSH